MKRFPVRGGSWNNGANAGLGALSLNNSRVNANSNIGFRPASDVASSTRLKGRCPCTLQKDAVSTAGAETLNGPADASAVCLYEQIYQFENLYRAAHQCRKPRITEKRERSKSYVRYFENLEENLIQLQNELVWSTYAPKPSRSFFVFEPKRRLIHAPAFYDRVAQRAIYNIIKPVVSKSFIYDSYACRTGKGTHKCADRAQLFIDQVESKHGRAYALKADISRYFSSINHGILKRLLAGVMPCPRVLELVYIIIDNSPAGSVGISLGELLNQLNANLYLHELDFYAKHKLRAKRYTRYMDDFVIIHHDKAQLQKWRKEIEVFLNTHLQLQTNSKTQVFPITPSRPGGKARGRGLDYVGYRIYAKYRLLRKCSVKRIKTKLKKHHRKYAAGEVDLADINPQIQSWLGHASHANTYNLRKTLLAQPFRRNNHV